MKKIHHFAITSAAILSGILLPSAQAQINSGQLERQVLQDREIQRQPDSFGTQNRNNQGKNNSSTREGSGPDRERLNEIGLLYIDLIEQIPDGATLLNAPYPHGYKTFGRTKPTFDFDSQIVGGVALKLNVKRPSKKVDKQGTTTPTIEEIRQGEIMCMTFWARAGQEKNASESAKIPSLGLQGVRKPYTKAFDKSVDLTKQWQHFAFAFHTNDNFQKGEAQIYFHYGNEKQSLEIGPVYLFNLGVGALSKATGKACKP